MQESSSISFKSPTNLEADNILKNINAIGIKNVADALESYPILTEYDEHETKKAKRSETKSTPDLANSKESSNDRRPNAILKITSSSSLVPRSPSNSFVGTHNQTDLTIVEVADFENNFEKRKSKSQGGSQVRGRHESKESGQVTPNILQSESDLVSKTNTESHIYSKLARELITGTKDWSRFVTMPVGDQ